MKFDTLHIFTVMGATYTFHSGMVIQDDERILKFSYTARSDDRMKVATFLKDNMSGWSVVAAEEE